MSPVIYFLADLYPWWGIPLAFILLEMANFHRRTRNRRKMLLYLSGSGSLIVIAFLYFFFNAKEHLQPAMRQVEQNWNQR